MEVLMSIDLTIKIGGEGGEGVISSGDFLMQAATLAGMQVVTFKSFPSEIKGGYALAQVRVSDEKILSQGDGFNVLVAFNGEAYEVNKPLLTPGTVLLYDSGEEADFTPDEIPGVTMYPVPMSGIARNELNNYIAKNMVALGAVSELFKIPMESLRESVKKKFTRKGEEVVQMNYNALDAGAKHVRDNLKKTDPFLFPPQQERQDVIIIEGNEAVALGAAMAGCNYYGAYPITPATSVGNYLANTILGFGGFVYQTEDEISALGTCLGASFAGAKTLSATSGPGMSLMSELIGLAVMSEIPVVIVDVQRGGPSTGMPTKHDQSDLLQAVFGTHGDAPRVVLSVSNVEENIYMTIEAFNIAEKYQTPVVLLTDASLALRTEVIPRPDMSKVKTVYREVHKGSDYSSFKRYVSNDSGVSPVGLPGMTGHAYAATGLEHAENSGPRTSPEVRTQMTDKRWRKFDKIEDEYQLVETEGDDDATVGVITWGLTKSITKEAIKRLRAKGKKVKALYPGMLWPLPMKAMTKFVDSVDKVVIPEANYQGQFAELIKMKIPIHDKLVKYNVYRGEPFIPKEVEEAIEKVIDGK